LGGYCLLLILVDHLLFRGVLLLQKINHAAPGHAQAAQGFVFLSGAMPRDVRGTNPDPFGLPEDAGQLHPDINTRYRPPVSSDGRLEMANPDDRTPEQIEREIEQTRRNTAATLAAIEDRLAPGRLVDEAWKYLRTSGQGQTFVSNLSATVRDNPIPVALLALSLAWLAIAGSRKESQRGGFRDDRALDYGAANYGDDDAILTEDAFRSSHAPAHSQRVEYVDPDTHHEHVSRSRADAPEGVSPTPDTLLGREHGRQSAAEAARVFETPPQAGTGGARPATETPIKAPGLTAESPVRRPGA
jgi:hypothetical protein